MKISDNLKNNAEYTKYRNKEQQVINNLMEIADRAINDSDFTKSKYNDYKNKWESITANFITEIEIIRAVSFLGASKEDNEWWKNELKCWQEVKNTDEQIIDIILKSKMHLFNLKRDIYLTKEMVKDVEKRVQDINDKVSDTFGDIADAINTSERNIGIINAALWEEIITVHINSKIKEKTGGEFKTLSSFVNFVLSKIPTYNPLESSSVYEIYSMLIEISDTISKAIPIVYSAGKKILCIAEINNNKNKQTKKFIETFGDKGSIGEIKKTIDKTPYYAKNNTVLDIYLQKPLVNRAKKIMELIKNLENEYTVLIKNIIENTVFVKFFKDIKSDAELIKEWPLVEKFLNSEKEMLNKNIIELRHKIQ